VHHYTIQISQPTRCKNFSNLLLDVYVQLNRFRASSRGAGCCQLEYILYLTASSTTRPTTLHLCKTRGW